MDVRVADGAVTIGSDSVPISRVTEVEHEREHRVLLAGLGIFLPMVLIVIIGKMSNESFTGFFPQLFGLASLAFGALLIFWGIVQGTPAGKLAGPFRSLILHFSKEDGMPDLKYLRFNQPADERLFLQAIENGLKVMPRAETTATPDPAPKPQGGKLRQLVSAFKF
jgi:hypothetical protein